MVFVIEGKVALITGGASGIGLSSAKELLRNGLKGVTLVDINESAGFKALEEIEKEFGKNTVIFVKADVSIKDEFENAFKKTLEHFNYVDILVNNAGIFNDAAWEKEVAINVNGTINGILLGLEIYLKNHKQGEEAVIINTASAAAFMEVALSPIYCATKHAIIGMTRCWSAPFHFERTKVRVLAICPAKTDTNIFCEPKNTVSDEYLLSWKDVPEEWLIDQKPEYVSQELVRILKYAKNGTLWIVEKGEPAYQYIHPCKNTFKENVLLEDQ